MVKRTVVWTECKNRLRIFDSKKNPRMKITGLFLLTLFSFTTYGQSWEWARSAPGSGEGCSIATDSSGNVYVTGLFVSPTITFGSYTLTNVGTNAGSGDIYIAKYDGTGTVIWAKRAGGSDSDLCYSVTTDVSGNVYIMGYFYSPFITFGTDTLINTGNANVFLAKYDASGNTLWAKSGQGTWVDEGRSVATDATGNVYITGDFLTPSLIFGTQTLTNSGGLDVFLAKYDSSGNVLWAKSAQGTASDWSNSVATDGSGNIYVTGRFNSQTLTFGTYTLTNSGSNDIFLAKYDMSGTVLWAVSVGGTGVDIGNSIAIDASSNIYLTGGFDSPSLNIGTYNFTNTGSSDIFIAKYDSSGNVLWAKSAAGIGNDRGYGLTTDSHDNVYIMGSFSYLSSNSITFDSTTLPFPTSGMDPMFIVKYDSTGKVLCSSTLASGGDDICGITTDIFDNVYVGNDFMINNFIVGPDILLLTGQETVFVAKCTFDCGASSTNELSLKEKIVIYPNPFSQETTIKTEINIKEATLTICNTLGQEIKKLKNISGQEIILHRDNLPCGLYFIQLSEDNKVITTKKLVITN